MKLSDYRKEAEQKADEQAALRLMSDAQEAEAVEDGMRRLTANLDVPFESTGLGIETIASGIIHQNVIGKYQFCAISIPLKGHAYIRASFSAKNGYSISRMKPDAKSCAYARLFESEDGEQWKQRKPMFYTGDWMERTGSVEKALKIIADMMTFHEKPEEAVKKRSEEEDQEIPFGSILCLALAVTLVIVLAMMR